LENNQILRGRGVISIGADAASVNDLTLEKFKSITGIEDVTFSKCSVHRLNRVPARMANSKRLCEPFREQTRTYMNLLVFFSTSERRNEIFYQSLVANNFDILALKDWSPTRMQGVFIANTRVMQVYYSIVEALGQMMASTDKNDASLRSEAKGYSDKIRSPIFIAMCCLFSSLGSIMITFSKFLDRDLSLICEVQHKKIIVIDQLNDLLTSQPIEEEKIYNLLDKEKNRWGFKQDQLVEIQFPRQRNLDGWDDIEKKIEVLLIFNLRNEQERSVMRLGDY